MFDDLSFPTVFESSRERQRSTVHEDSNVLQYATKNCSAALQYIFWTSDMCTNSGTLFLWSWCNDWYVFRCGDMSIVCFLFLPLAPLFAEANVGNSPWPRRGGGGARRAARPRRGSRVSAAGSRGAARRRRRRSAGSLAGGGAAAPRRAMTTTSRSLYGHIPVVH